MERKVALISASSAGLGAATAKVLAAAGFRVVINYNSSAEKAQALVREIQGQLDDQSVTSPRCIAIQADVSQRDGIKHLVEKTIEAMHRLDVVVSNQGWTRMRRFYDLDENVDEDDWDMCFRMNVKSHLFLFHATKPFLASTNGVFITVASLAGVVPSGSSLAYASTKAAQLHMARGLAMISGPNVRVNSVSPGILLTEWGKKFPTDKLDAAKEKSVLKRLALIEDVAQQILLYANSKSTTGCNAIIDCGWSLG
ncbi:short-chain dehydrogenase [Myriangium duriaei CBS 260.36]|uniref:Short-chain dehydrogenase n=1 Tax=Myriangium duriaei CBS 260.36 TaxID=1168546 RepID=A0A9P4JAE8_9PEZI|nr:short-chain dehydrogenase [Myriangium duriaei CBS 260.36]